MRLVFVLILVGSCLSKKGSQRPIEATAKPSTCRYEELKGNWIFDVGEGGYDKATIINCLLNGSGQQLSNISPTIIIYSCVVRV